MKTLITSLLVMLIGLLSVMSYAGVSGNMVVNPINKEWTLYKTVNDVEIYYKVAECHQVQKGMHKEYVLLKFVNTSNSMKKIEWDNHLWYDGSCLTCDGDKEHRAKIILKENETISGECDEVINSHLRIFSRFLNYDDKQELTEFEIVNIKVETK